MFNNTRTSNTQTGIIHLPLGQPGSEGYLITLILTNWMALDTAAERSSLFWHAEFIIMKFSSTHCCAHGADASDVAGCFDGSLYCRGDDCKISDQNVEEYLHCHWNNMVCIHASGVCIIHWLQVLRSFRCIVFAGPGCCCSRTISTGGEQQVAFPHMCLNLPVGRAMVRWGEVRFAICCQCVLCHWLRLRPRSPHETSWVWITLHCALCRLVQEHLSYTTLNHLLLSGSCVLSGFSQPTVCDPANWFGTYSMLNYKAIIRWHFFAVLKVSKSGLALLILT